MQLLPSRFATKSVVPLSKYGSHIASSSCHPAMFSFMFLAPLKGETFIPPSIGSQVKGLKVYIGKKIS